MIPPVDDQAAASQRGLLGAGPVPPRHRRPALSGVTCSHRPPPSLGAEWTVPCPCPCAHAPMRREAPVGTLRRTLAAPRGRRGRGVNRVQAWGRRRREKRGSRRPRPSESLMLVAVLGGGDHWNPSLNQVLPTEPNHTCPTCPFLAAVLPLSPLTSPPSTQSPNHPTTQPPSRAGCTRRPARRPARCQRMCTRRRSPHCRGLARTSRYGKALLDAHIQVSKGRGGGDVGVGRKERSEHRWGPTQGGPDPGRARSRGGTRATSLRQRWG